MLCDVLALPRSSWYYNTVQRDERDLQKAVEQVIGRFPTYGSRRVAHQLRSEHGEFKAIGRKRVRRVLGEMGLKLRPKAIKKQPTVSRHCFPRYENLVKGSMSYGPIRSRSETTCTARSGFIRRLAI